MERPRPGAFSGGLGREERIEHLFLHVRRDAGAVVTDPDFNTIAKIFGRGREGWLVVAPIRSLLCAWSLHKIRLKSN